MFDVRRFCSRSSVVVAAFFVGSFAAHADVAPDIKGAGPGFEPPADNPAAKNIAMKSERVLLEVHDDPAGAFVVVDATFHMAAPLNKDLAKKTVSKATKLQVAFPGEGVRVGGEFAVHPKLAGFRAFIDGVPVASRDDVKTQTESRGPPGREYKRTRSETWHVFPAAIDDETTLRVRYAVAATPVSGEREGYASIQYILHTGSLWSGAIDPAVVEVTGVNVDVTKTSLRTLAMSPVSLISLSSDQPPPPVMPSSAQATSTRTPTSITATFTALEPGPNDDVEVVFPAGHVSWSTTPELLAAMETAAKKAP